MKPATLFEVGQKIENFVGAKGLVVATRVAARDVLISWDDENEGRYWCSSQSLVLSKD